MGRDLKARIFERAIARKPDLATQFSIRVCEDDANVCRAVARIDLQSALLPNAASLNAQDRKLRGREKTIDEQMKRSGLRARHAKCAVGSDLGGEVSGRGRILSHDIAAQLYLRQACQSLRACRAF